LQAEILVVPVDKKSFDDKPGFKKMFESGKRFFMDIFINPA